MSKERRNFIYLADGVAILQDYAYVSPEFVKAASQTTFTDFIATANKDVIDINATRLCCIQLSPFELEADPKRYENKAQTLSKFYKALHYYKKKYPDKEFFYKPSVISDEIVPQIAKETGTKLIHNFEVIPLEYKNGEISDDVPQTSTATFYPSNDEKKFNICVRKRFFTVDRKLMTQGKNKIKRLLTDPKTELEKKIDTFEQLINKTYASEKDLEIKAEKYLDRMTRFEDELCQKLVFDHYNEPDIVPILAHECRHMLNKIFLAKRQSDPQCTPLKPYELLQLLIHDEISASTQEILTSFAKSMKGLRLHDTENFEDLAPIHYKKFMKANRQSRANMLKNPSSIVKEISKNWHKNFFSLYVDQFCNLLQEYQSAFPASLVSFDQTTAETDEYRLEKGMLYTFAVYNPETDKDEYIDCSEHSKDVIHRLPKILKKALKNMELSFRQEQYELQKAGIDSDLIAKARMQNWTYCQNQSGQSAQIFAKIAQNFLHTNNR